MLTIKINNRLKLREFAKGIKLFVKLNNNWKCIKFNKEECSLLYSMLKIFFD